MAVLLQLRIELAVQLVNLLPRLLVLDELADQKVRALPDLLVEPGPRYPVPHLLERGYEVWFVTSAKDEELEHHMAELEAEGKVSGVVNSSAVENPKPAPDIFELTLERAGASPDETVAVGDAIWDIESASAAGIRTVAVLTGGAFCRQELEDAGAAGVYKDCAALLESGFPD